MAFRQILLDTIAINPSKRYKPQDLEIISKINRELSSINGFRCRSYVDSLSSMAQLDLNQDIKFREELAMQMNREKFQKNLKYFLSAYYSGLGKPVKEIQDKYQALEQIFGEMRQYHKFMHLTACELAVVALNYANFKEYFELSHALVQSDDFALAIKKLKKEMLDFERSMVLCMQQHLKIFAANQGGQGYQDCLPPSDILYFYFNKIIALVGHGSNFVWPQGLLVDDSLLYKMPDLPFETEQDLNARICFESVIRSYYAISDDTQGIKAVLDIASKKTMDLVSGTWDITKAVLTSPVWLTQQGVDAIVSWRSSPETSRKDVVPVEDGLVRSLSAQNSLAAKLSAIDAKMSRLQKATDKMLSEHQQQLRSDRYFSEACQKIAGRINELDGEIQRWSFGCFAFFFKSKIDLKRQKVNALRELLKCHSGEQLYTEVSSILSDKIHAPIVQGFFSSTKEVLEQVKTDLSKSLSR